MGFTTLKVCTEVIKTSKHLLKINRLHYNTILSKLQKNLKLVPSLHNKAINHWEKFFMCCTWM